MAARWSDDDVKVCLSLISENPDNIAHAFRKASKIIDRAAKTIAMSWYGKSGRLYKERQSKNIFRLMSLDESLANCKNNIAKGQESLR